MAGYLKKKKKIHALDGTCVILYDDLGRAEANDGSVTTKAAASYMLFDNLGGENN